MAHLVDANWERKSRFGAWLHALRRWRPSRRLRITREGKYFLGITFGVGVAAINTANNLLYLLLGLLLSLIVISSIMSESTLRGLRVIRKLPRRAQVGRPHQVEIEVHNDKAHIPSYAIEVEDIRQGQPADKRCFFLKISPRSTQVAAYRRTPGKRGPSQHRGFRVATRFPFGLFEKSLEIDLEGTLLVYPAVDRVELPIEEPGGTIGGERVHARGHGDEIMGLRPMRDGDDPRDIYWRRSTQPDQRVLRVRAEETQSEVKFTINTARPPAKDSSQWLDQFERNIREVASYSVAHLRRGNTVRIHTTSQENLRVSQPQGVDAALAFLARLEPAEPPTPNTNSA
jgi:uncharacterized protein (DUF58 family)